MNQNIPAQAMMAGAPTMDHAKIILIVQMTNGISGYFPERFMAMMAGHRMIPIF